MLNKKRLEKAASEQLDANARENQYLFFVFNIEFSQQLDFDLIIFSLYENIAGNLLTIFISSVIVIWRPE
eukprot:scaffold22766_cov131-Cylindrotheca_fusiformis.AAC.7